MLFPRLIFGAPLIAQAPRCIAGVCSLNPRSQSLQMDIGGDESQVAQAYAGIFSRSPGISKAWAFPGRKEGLETLMVQRTARDIEGETGKIKLRS